MKEYYCKQPQPVVLGILSALRSLLSYVWWRISIVGIPAIFIIGTNSSELNF